MRNLLIYIMAVFYCTVALAGVQKPSEITPYINAVQSYGEGVYSQFLIKCYDASLWTDAKQWSMNVKFALSLRYRIHFTTQEIVQRSIAEMQHIAPLPRDKVHDYA